MSQSRADKVIKRKNRGGKKKQPSQNNPLPEIFQHYNKVTAFRLKPRKLVGTYLVVRGELIPENHRHMFRYGYETAEYPVTPAASGAVTRKDIPSELPGDGVPDKEVAQDPVGAS